MTSGKEIPDYVVNQIRRLRRQGYSIREITRLVGCAKATVEKYVKISETSDDAKVDD